MASAGQGGRLTQRDLQGLRRESQQAYAESLRIGQRWRDRLGQCRGYMAWEEVAEMDAAMAACVAAIQEEGASNPLVVSRCVFGPGL